MAQRMLVGRMGQRSHDRPEMTSLCQAWQVLGNFQARSLRCDRGELTTDLCRSLRLGIKTLELRQSTREENINAGFRCPVGASGRIGRLQTCQMITAQPEQSDGSGLHCSPARNTRMRQLWKLIEAHQFIPSYREIAFRK